MKKYKLTDETLIIFGIRLHRIEALRDFGDVKKGEQGGFVQSEENLSHLGTCWVDDNACVFDKAQVYDSAVVRNSANVYNNAKIFGNAEVLGNTKIYGNAEFLVMPRL